MGVEDLPLKSLPPMPPPPLPPMARLGTMTLTTTLKNANEDADDEERDEILLKNVICFSLNSLHPSNRPTIHPSGLHLFFSLLFFQLLTPKYIYRGCFHSNTSCIASPLGRIIQLLQSAISKRSHVLAFSTIRFITMQSVHTYTHTVESDSLSVASALVASYSIRIVQMQIEKFHLCTLYRAI